MTLKYFHREAVGLFNQPPLARTSDPDTSHAAADRLTKSGRRSKMLNRVVEVIRKFPDCTVQELGIKTPDLNEHDIGRRVKEAETRGLIVRGEPRECTVTGRYAATWRIVR